MTKLTARRSAALVVFVAGAILPSRLAGAEIPLPQQPNPGIENSRNGKLPVKTAEMIVVARWLADRLVHPPFNGLDPTKSSVEAQMRLFDEASRWFNCWSNVSQAPNDIQRIYMNELGKAVAVECMMIIAEAPEKLEKVNAARLLAMAGKMACEPLADTYLKLIKEDKYPPEIKLYAFQGLRNLLAIPSLDEFEDTRKQFISKKDKLAEIAIELDKFITRKPPANMPSEDVRVAQFIRRHAVEALAQIKPGIVRRGQDPPLAKPIWTLLRVASNDSVVGGAAKRNDDTLPGYPYHIQERIEAVIGILSMVPDRQMNIDVVAYVLDDALLDITNFQSAERARHQKDPRNRPLVPWKITGVRMVEAMNTWKANLALRSPPPPNFASVGIDLVNRVGMSSFKKLEQDGVAAPSDARALADWKNAHVPKSTQVLADDPTTAAIINK